MKNIEAPLVIILFAGLMSLITAQRDDLLPITRLKDAVYLLTVRLWSGCIQVMLAAVAVTNNAEITGDKRTNNKYNYFASICIIPSYLSL